MVKRTEEDQHEQLVKPNQKSVEKKKKTKSANPRE